MKYGLKFEDAFRDSLVAMACDVRADATLDHEEKTDLVIMAIEHTPLRPPARVQVTLRVGNRAKLEEFVLTNARAPEDSIYVEIDERCSPDQAAMELKRTLLTKYHRGCHKLSIGIDGSSLVQIPVPPPDAQPRRRSCGLVVKRVGDGFDILSERGGFFLARPADIADLVLRQTLMRQERNRRFMQRIRVSFEPDESGGTRTARTVRALKE